MHENNTKDLRDYTKAFCKKYRFYLLSLCSIAVIASILSILVNYQVKEIIDSIAYNNSQNTHKLLLLFIFYKFAYHGIYFIGRVLDIHYKPSILIETVIDAYQQTTSHSLHWFDSHLSGEISTKITDFQNGIILLIFHAFRLLNNLSTIAISIIFLLRINTTVTLVLLLFIITYCPITYLLLCKQMRIQRDYVSIKQRSIGMINDSIANIFSVKIIGTIANEFKLKILPSLLTWQSLDKRTRKFETYIVDNFNTFMVTLMVAAQIYLLAFLYQKGVITAGGFAFVAMAVINIHEKLDHFLLDLLFNINPTIAQIKSSFAFITKDNDTHNIPTGNHIINSKNDKAGLAIQFDNVYFSYKCDNDKEQPVLKGLNLSIAPGEKIGIVGASGAGKTTIIKCLLRYFDIDSGSILVDGVNIKDVDPESLRKNISIIPQDAKMFHRSIRENLQIAHLEATDDDIIQACKQAKIHDDIMQMPCGYDSIVGENGTKISGGQRQRIAIARAILRGSPISILDEATSSLDIETESLIKESLQKMLNNKNTTVIAIAHRLSTLKHMDRIIVLDNGVVIEEGKHDILTKKENGLYKKLWDMQII